jgi:hypothetical protein
MGRAVRLASVLNNMGAAYLEQANGDHLASKLASDDRSVERILCKIASLIKEASRDQIS